jgi:hypothetical protein
MKPVTWDMPGLTYDDPNLRWGDPSFLLEPGDPGYVSTVSPTQPKKTYRTMSNNPIPNNERAIMALAEDCADGCNALEASIGLKLTKEDDLRPMLLGLKGDPSVLPPTPASRGSIYRFKEAEKTRQLLDSARGTADYAGRVCLTDARTSLLPILGRDPSPEWALAGFSDPQTGSNAVPSTQDGRLAALALLAIYLGNHLTYEVPAGGVRKEVTAARATLCHDAVSNARLAANTAATAQAVAKAEKDDGVRALRQQLIVLVDELALRLSDDDARWETFGLNIPSNPRAPEPASELVFTALGGGKGLAEWERGTRSTDDRILIMVLGTDTEFREYGKSGGDGQEILKNLPVGATVRIKIVALNGSLEAASGPEAEIVVT